MMRTLAVIALQFIAINGASVGKSRESVEERPESFRYVEGSTASAYMFPWACFLYLDLHYSESGTGRLGTDYGPISSCSIFAKNWVITSMGNLALKYWFVPYYKVFSDKAAIERNAIMIQAGADTAKYYYDDVLKQMDPEGISQRVRADQLHVLLDPIMVTLTPDLSGPLDPDTHTSRKTTAVNPTNITDGEDLMIFDVMAHAMDSVFIKTGGDFEWTPFVLSVSVSHRYVTPLEQFTYEKIDLMETAVSSSSLCYVHSWQPRTFTLRYHQISYVGINDCRSTWCSKFPSTCLLFPFRDYDVCFMPTTYGDICSHDQGAAVYCKWNNDAVFAIAKYSKDCGLHGTPSVYTLLSAVIRFWYLINFKAFDETLENGPGHNEFSTELFLGEVFNQPGNSVPPP